MKAKYRKIIEVHYANCRSGGCGYLNYYIADGSGGKIPHSEHMVFPVYIPKTQREKFFLTVVKKEKGITSV